MPDRGAVLQRTARPSSTGRSGASGGAPRPSSAPSSPPPQVHQMPQMPAMPAPQIQMSAPPPPMVQAPTIPTTGGAPGLPPTAPGGPGGAPGSAAFNSPELMEYLNRVRTRLDTPGDDTRALNQAGQAINAFAQGQRNNAVGDAARRGVLGSGAGAQVQDDIGVVAQQQFGQASENIALQRMRDNDAMLMGAQSAFVEPGRQNLADRGLGVQAQGQANQYGLGVAGLNLAAQQANQQAAMGVAQQNLSAQLAAQSMAQQQYLAMMQMYGNIYR